MPHKKGHSKKKTLKVKKGGYYGFNGAVGTGAPNWTSHSEMGLSSIAHRSGNGMYGRGRKRKGKKSTRKLKRGGGSFGQVSQTFQGTGARGMADAVGVSANKPGFATQGQFNNFGAQPGSGFKSFITTSSK
jgi:hypothetical protein